MNKSNKIILLTTNCDFYQLSVPQIRFHDFWHYINLYACMYTHTQTHPFNGPLSRTTRVSRYQKGKTNLDFTEPRDNGWQWHQLGRMQVCTSLQTDNHACTPPLTGWLSDWKWVCKQKSFESVEADHSWSHTLCVALSTHEVLPQSTDSCCHTEVHCHMCALAWTEHTTRFTSYS